ncbi:quaternary ammonium compound-resistance protein SugE [Thermosporothrix hazakensis]|jgi:quaternary ammonium compound-resistance protein SugE|uniref:Quaternary ammonium compound-resistance protein SugE n=2 Tax=Thermosporothrix TaxID=768650 RepID=A0A326U4C8_THEHA|nr:multidrug efflux SMR transporter [Thermosporothrix hazakensis]PZW25707.1 quaternary ammonium compound-resistance protein SugE [Thermosporothrix hazakensis]BBH90002.1 molecular chaperone [Thermosporothrix sp. COM3]GCE48202.1 molecular chaperone [Thermosporothrix hazakensis]
MAWILLVIAGFAEVAMAYFLKLSEGFTRLWPSIGMVAFAVLSFYLLSQAVKSLPVGVAYAVWTGIGAAGSVLIGILFLGESRDLLKLLSIVLIVAGVIGLQITGGGH